jgi:hypothetical protein
MIDNSDRFKVKCDKCSQVKPICYTGKITLCHDCLIEIQQRRKGK